MDAREGAFVARLATHLESEDSAAYAQFAVRTRSPLARGVLRAAGEHALLGQVLALSTDADGGRRGLALLDEAVAREGLQSLSSRGIALWADLLLRSGRDAELRSLLDERPADLSDLDRWKLRTDLVNPHRTSWDEDEASTATAVTGQAEQEWLQTFNEVHSRSELEPIRLRPAQAGENPYQRLEALATESVDGDPVTVVMSAFRPDADLRLAVRGVLQQSWRNIDLLIVDDGSPPGSEALLEEVESMDHRVRVVRRERNQGTYEARNLAMSIARGRWMTFQDSDDWTHPRRVERQVRHLQESPSVLANRTRTLRAYPDMTMTFPGYAPERVNSSSLLFDLHEVAKVVGEFDSTRKAGDTEFPERLLAVRPGSVRDLTHPAPLAITQLRAGSLSRNQMLPGWSRWDRLAYRDSYREWHRQIEQGRSAPTLPARTGRPFPLPRPEWNSRLETDRTDGAATSYEWDVVVLGDFRRTAHGRRRSLGVARASATAALRTAVAEAELPNPPSMNKPSLMADVTADVRRGHLGRTDVHETDACALLVVTEPESVLHLDEAALQVERVLVVADESTPRRWTVTAVDRRCRELFGVEPTWGGPARVHGGPHDQSEVRRAVPDEHWSAWDLGVVVGDQWHLVEAPRPDGRRPDPNPSPVLLGHHLQGSSRRWPSSATDLEVAYPTQVDDNGRARPVEVHAYRGLNKAAVVLGQRVPPPSWVSFATTEMTVREYLSHIDVWVYFGEWDIEAEAAALEALGAGLPCVLGEDAAVSGLEGPVRCVAPPRARSAIEELLASPDEVATSSSIRQGVWAQALRDLARRR